MKKTNCPNVKNNKRKVALSNLEKQLNQGGYTDVFNRFIKLSEERTNQIKEEIAVLKSRITHV